LTTTIVLSRDSLPALPDMDFWYVGVHDAGGAELFRKDLVPDQIYSLLRQERPSFEFQYRAAGSADSWTVWPHSREKGWLNKISGRA
jgi:hypothetical protein